MPTPPSHERVVARLLADAHSVCPLWSPHTRLAFWLVLQVLVLGVAVKVGLRQDLGDHLRQPLFLLELGVMVAAGTMAAAMALRGAVPGMASDPFTVMCSVVLVSAAAGEALAFPPLATRAPRSSVSASRPASRCCAR